MVHQQPYADAAEKEQCLGVDPEEVQAKAGEDQQQRRPQRPPRQQCAAGRDHVEHHLVGQTPGVGGKLVGLREQIGESETGKDGIGIVQLRIPVRHGVQDDKQDRYKSEERVDPDEAPPHEFLERVFCGAPVNHEATDDEEQEHAGCRDVAESGDGVVIADVVRIHVLPDSTEDMRIEDQGSGETAKRVRGRIEVPGTPRFHQAKPFAALSGWPSPVRLAKSRKVACM